MNWYREAQGGLDEVTKYNINQKGLGYYCPDCMKDVPPNAKCPDCGKVLKKNKWIRKRSENG